MSAFYTKYRIEFADLRGLVWKIDIQEYLGSQPAITNLIATGQPLTIEFNTDGDEFNSPFRESKAVFNVIATTDFALEDLYSVEDLHFKTLIYAGTPLYWQGFVVVGEDSEPYTCTPYPVKITAVDGLSYLRQCPYKYTITIVDDTYYNGRTLESQIILDILGKIEITGFTEYLNIYEITHLQTTDDSPLDQTKIDVDVFRDMTCYDVLYNILIKYNAVIRQVGGGFVTYRPIELTDATVYGRIFTGATTKTSTTLAPDQVINRAGDASDLWQFPGSTKWTKKSVKKLTANQDYGYKQSWIDDWELNPSMFELVGGNWVNKLGVWVSDEPDQIQPLANGYGGSGANAVYLLNNTTNLHQSFGTYSLITANLLSIEFEYLLFNNNVSAQTGVIIKVRVKSDSASKYLYIQDDVSCAWDNSANDIIITGDVAVGQSDVKSFKRVFSGLPAGGSYTITLGATDHANVIVAYKNIRIISTSDKIVTKFAPKLSGIGNFFNSIKLFGSIKGENTPYLALQDNAEIVIKTYIVTNSINGVEMGLDFILGDAVDTNIDNVLEQFAGSLSVVALVGGTGATAQVDQITKNSTAVNTDVRINNYTRTMIWNTDEATTIAAFVISYAGAFGAVTLYHDGTSVYFTATADVAGTPFLGTTLITEGSVTTTTANNPGTSPSPVDIPSTQWNRIGVTDNIPLLQIVTGEIGSQYSRPKKLMQMNIYDGTTPGPVLNIIGNIQDSLYQLSAVNRIFVFNRGELDVKNRIWNCDLVEII